MELAGRQEDRGVQAGGHVRVLYSQYAYLPHGAGQVALSGLPAAQTLQAF